MVKVNARQDTPEGRKFLVTGEFWLPPDACDGASVLRRLCEAYDRESSRRGRLATMRKRQREGEEVSPGQEGSQEGSQERSQKRSKPSSSTPRQRR